MKKKNSTPSTKNINSLRSENDFLKKNRIRNTTGISLVEFFWGMGIPTLIESTFLQLFLRDLGASYLLIGMLPMFLGISIPVFSLVSAYFTTHFEYKRPIVILLHMGSALPVLLFGVYLLVFRPADGILPLFLIVYAVFTSGIGLTISVWQNFLVKIFHEKDSLRSLSVMMIAQSLAKIIASYGLIKVVEQYALSIRGAGFVFTAVGISLFFGAILFLITRESGKTDENLVPFKSPAHFFITMKDLLQNKRFLVFIGNDLNYFSVLAALSFYANYATEYGGIHPALVAGLFVGFGYAGGIAVQVVLGWMNILPLKGKFLFSKAAAFSGLLLLIFMPVLPAFLAAAFLLGASRDVRKLAYPPAIKNIARGRDATVHFAFAALLELPVSSGLPLISGWFLDIYPGGGMVAYKILFTVLALVTVISTVFTLRLSFPAVEK